MKGRKRFRGRRGRTVKGKRQKGAGSSSAAWGSTGTGAVWDSTDSGERKKTREKAVVRRPCGADAGEGQGRQRMGMPCGNRVDRRPVAHPPLWGVERGEGGGGGGAARQPRRSQEEVRSRIGL